MLTKVEIKNYRCFPSFRMDGLARVNLLVGKNNSGKTALLEAVQFLASGGDPLVLDSIARRRGEYVMTRSGRKIVDVNHFFHGHQIAPSDTILISGDNGFKPVTVRALAGASTFFDESDDDEGIEPTALSLQLEGGQLNEGIVLHYGLTREGGIEFQRPKQFRSVDQKFQNIRFIGTQVQNISELMLMSNELKINRTTDQVVLALQTLDPEVQTYDILTNGSEGPLSNRMIVIGRNNEKLSPIGSLGDGMLRILSLAMNLACSNQGSLCVDEIDTGLHYSIMPEMWKLVLDQATTKNIQVFATTHSWDCIEGLARLCEREPRWQEHVAVHKLDRNLARNVVFDGQSLVGMAKHHIDPR